MKQRQTTEEKKHALGTARSFLYRIRIIYGELMEGKRNARQLAALLEVSTKTIYRDLDYMRDMLEMDMESSNTGRTLLDGVHQCPICGTGCNGNNQIAPRGTVAAIMRGLA